MNERDADRRGTTAQHSQPAIARSVELPQASEDQQRYVADIVAWAEQSFKPDAVIGGPKSSVD